MIRPPPSALALAAALRHPFPRRPNPGEGVGFRLWTQRPEPEQPWILRGEYAELEWALDDATFDAREPGTVVRVDWAGAPARDETLAWLGVALAPGEVVRAGRPTLSVPGTWSTWLEMWEGPIWGEEAVARQCRGVPGRALVQAASACARLALPLVTPGEEGPRRALEAVERWAQAAGEGRWTAEGARDPRALEALRAAAETARRWAGRFPWEDTSDGAVVQRAVAYAVAYAAEAARDFEGAPQPPVEAVEFLGMSLTQARVALHRARPRPNDDFRLLTEAREAVLTAFRAHVSLGMVLLGRAQTERREARR